MREVHHSTSDTVEGCKALQALQDPVLLAAERELDQAGG